MGYLAGSQHYGCIPEELPTNERKKTYTQDASENINYSPDSLGQSTYK